MSPRATKVKVIESERVTKWGNWSEFESCNNSFATSYRQRVDPFIGRGHDDTALNEIELTCANGQRVRGAEGRWGEWSEVLRCSDGGGFKGFKMKNLAPQTRGVDDLAAISLAMICTNNSVLIPPNEIQLGEWTSARMCSDGFVICGLRVQIDKPPKNKDDTALNNVDFQCCSMDDFRVSRIHFIKE